MAIKTDTEGFFSSNGVIKTTALTNTTGSQQTRPSSTPQESIEDLARRETAAAITEAAVVSITQRLRTAGTSFEQGLSATVEEAVFSALRNSSRESSGDTPALRAIQGTYQNEIMYGSQSEPPAPPSSEPDDIVIDEPPPEPISGAPEDPAPEPPRGGAGRGRGRSGEEGFFPGSRARFRR